MFTQVAVVPLDPSEDVQLDMLLRIAAAIQVQVQRDLGPKWDLQAAVSAFQSLRDVPQGTWPVAVTNREGLPVDGFHFVMNGLPFGVVGNSEKLSVVLSHEISEMLVDPSGSRTIAGPSLAGDDTVQYFVEVCDVCEYETYAIDGIEVSDFVLPGYYDMNRSRPHGYSFTGSVSEPRQVLPGGYISWREQFPDTAVWQAFALPGPQISRIHPDARQLARVARLGSVANPGSQAVKQLKLLKLPNAPTRAWRELVADVARQPVSQAQAPATSQRPDGNEKFADAFRVNIKALLEAMKHQRPAPSIPELVRAIEDPQATKTLGQVFLQGATINKNAGHRAKIIKYLKQQESLSGIFGPDIDPELAMWMYMIMP